MKKRSKRTKLSRRPKKVPLSKRIYDLEQAIIALKDHYNQVGWVMTLGQRMNQVESRLLLLTQKINNPNWVSGPDA